jgi:hypothetical protein
MLRVPIEEKRHMTKASVTKANPAYQATIVESTKLERTKFGARPTRR